MNAEREYNGILFKTCSLIFLTEPKMQFSFFQYKREKNFTLLLYSFLEISMQIVSLFLITRHFMAFQISKICKCTSVHPKGCSAFLVMKHLKQL